jgi:Cu2+-containing amine oxidase
MPQQPLLSPVEESKVRRLAQEPKQARSLTKLLEAIERRAIEAALRSKQVSDRLKGTRHEVVAIDLPAFEPSPAAKRAAGEGKQTSPMAEIGVYDYDRNVLVVPIVDLRSGTVRTIDERRGLQPALTARELAEAKRIVFADRRNRALRQNAGLQVTSFPVRAAFLEGHANYGHRCFVFYFWTGGKRPRKVGQAVVDLSTGQLVPVDAVKTDIDGGDDL